MARTVDYYMKRYAALQNARQPFDTLWRDLADFIVPQRSFQFQSGQPMTAADQATTRNRRSRVYDSTAEIALDVFSSSLVGFLANPAMNWFELAPTDDSLLEDPEVAAWFDTVTARMLSAFNEPNAKFYSNLKMSANDIGVFGTVGMSIQRGKKSLLEFSSKNIKELYIAEDASGNIDTVYRFLMKTARQLVEQFGNNVSASVLEKFKEQPDTLIAVINAIEPREGFERPEGAIRSKSNLEMPILSIWIEKDTQHIIQETGFEEMPIPVARWDVMTNDVYGTSPATKVLADIKMLNQMEKAHIVAAEKSLNPPLMMPDDGFMGNIDLSAGAINVYRSMSNGRLEPIQTIGNLPITLEMVQSKRNLIREAFYVDQLQLQTSPQMTATEVMARTDEKLRMMAPMIGRVQSELLGPIIERSFFLLLRLSEENDFENSPFPLPPEVLGRANYKVKYVSPLARAQRGSEANSILAWVNSTVPLTEVAPDILDNINFDELVRVLHDIQSVPAVLLNDRDAVEQARNARAEQQRAQQLLMQGQEAADIAKTANQAGLMG